MCRAVGGDDFGDEFFHSLFVAYVNEMYRMSLADERGGLLQTRFVVVGKCEPHAALRQIQGQRATYARSGSGDDGDSVSGDLHSSFQFSVFSFQFSVFSFQFSVFSFQFSVFSFQFSVHCRQ
jgi:hypothetical protein